MELAVASSRTAGRRSTRAINQQAQAASASSLDLVTHLFEDKQQDTENSIYEEIHPASIFAVPIPPCPNPKTIREVDSRTGEIVRTPFITITPKGILIRGCGSNRCFSCRLVNARNIAYAIKLAEPNWSFVITCAHCRHSLNADGMRRFITEVRKEIPDFNAAWVTELNLNGTVIHIHGFFHTRTKRLRTLENVIRAASYRVGFGHAHVQGVPRGANADYFAYPMKSLSADHLAEGFVALNSTGKTIRLIHSSNWFWRDGEDGQQGLTRAKAESIAWQRERARRLKERFDEKCL
jgi:hypothetical protein